MVNGNKRARYHIFSNLKNCLQTSSFMMCFHMLFCFVTMSHFSFLYLQTTFFYGFKVLLSFLAEILYRTIMKSLQKASFGPQTCEIEPKVWFLASGFCLLRLGEPSGGNWGNPNGPDAVQRFKTLYKNPLEIPKGIPS